MEAEDIQHLNDDKVIQDWTDKQVSLIAENNKEAILQLEIDCMLFGQSYKQLSVVDGEVVVTRIDPRDVIPTEMIEDD